MDDENTTDTTNTSDTSDAPAEVVPYDAERFAIVALLDDDPMTALGYPYEWQERGETRGHGATEADCVRAILTYTGAA